MRFHDFPHNNVRCEECWLRKSVGSVIAMSGITIIYQQICFWFFSLVLHLILVDILSFDDLFMCLWIVYIFLGVYFLDFLSHCKCFCVTHIFFLLWFRYFNINKLKEEEEEKNVRAFTLNSSICISYDCCCCRLLNALAVKINGWIFIAT